MGELTDKPDDLVVGCVLHGSTCLQERLRPSCREPPWSPLAAFAFACF